MRDALHDLVRAVRIRLSAVDAHLTLRTNALVTGHQVDASTVTRVRVAVVFRAIAQVAFESAKAFAGVRSVAVRFGADSFTELVESDHFDWQRLASAT